LAIIALTASTAGVLAVASPASAATGKVNTAGAPLTVRSAPNTGASAIGSIADGTSVTISCQTYGKSISGTYGTTTVWDYIPAKGGFVSDAYMYTGSDGLVAPVCTDTDIISQCATGGCPGQATYNRNDHKLTVYDNKGDGDSGVAMYWLNDGTGPHYAWNTQGSGSHKVFTISLPTNGWVFFNACTGSYSTRAVSGNCSNGQTGYA